MRLSSVTRFVHLSLFTFHSAIQVFLQRYEVVLLSQRDQAFTRGNLHGFVTFDLHSANAL